jgi:hypothetical protein
VGFICFPPGLVVLSTIGHTLSISTLMGQRMRKKRTTTLFINLALADFMVTVFAIAGIMSNNQMGILLYLSF